MLLLLITFHVSICGLGRFCFAVFNFKLFFYLILRSSKAFAQFLLHTFYSHQQNLIIGAQTEKVKPHVSSWDGEQ
jgi:hypothetical protein